MILDLYAIIMIFSAGFCLAISYNSWRRYATGAGRSLAVLQLSLGLWSLFQGIEVMQTNLHWKVLYSAFSYLGVATVGPALLIFSFNMGRQALPKKLRIALWSVSALIILTAFSNSWHHQLWPKMVPHRDAAGDLYLEYGHGIAFYFIITFNYSCIIAALIKLVLIFKNSTYLNRHNRTILALSILFPWMTSILYVLGLQPHPGIDITPMGFILTAVLVNHAMESQLLSLGPMARESLVETMEEGVIVIDSLQRFVDANASGRQLLALMGISTETIKDFELWSESIVHQKETKGEWEWGSSIAWHLIPLSSTGVHAGTLIVLRDISSEKSIQLQLKNALHAAKGASKAKSDFLSAMSHEIRTPLNAIIGLGRELSHHEHSEENRSMVQSIVFSGENLLALVNDLLDWSKIEAGKMELDPIPLHLNELLHNVRSSLEIRAKEKGIQLSLKNLIPMDLCHLRLDGMRLIQVLVNLVGNAIKFTHQGTVDLQAELLMQEGKQVQIRISVIDQGIGIAADKIDKIFERFSQAESDTARRFGGTGLGLSISSNLLSLMGSQIKVKSELGKGSTFYFDLWLDLAETLATDTNPQEQATLFHADALIIDDVKLNLVVGKKSLERKGLKVQSALSGQEALQMDLSQFQIVFLDLHMPEMDGFEVIGALRSRHFKGPIIALTADVSHSVKQRIATCGFDGFLAKPFKDEELLHILREHCPAQSNS